MPSAINAYVATLSALVSQGLHTWTPLERALGVLAAALVGGYVLGRPLAWAVRIALVVAGVLIAARLAGIAA